MPVKNPASSLDRKATTPAISSGVAGRPRGTRPMNPAMRSAMSAPGSRPKKEGSIGVSTGPGQITFTRMPSGPPTRASARVKDVSAPLVSE